MAIAVLLSGGVDSSVALHLLVDQGHRDITAFYIKIWLEDEMAFLGSCPWQEDLDHARAVCADAEIELEVISLQRPYFDRVVSTAIDELIVILAMKNRADSISSLVLGLHNHGIIPKDLSPHDTK